MRKPKVENRYNLKPKDIQKTVILDRNRLQQEPFWRNNVINAWCLSGGCGKDYFGGFDSEYWIGFYDEDAKSYAGKIKLNMYCVGGMCSYNPSKFFDAKEIESENDLKIQEMLLERINWMVDEGIIEIRKQ